MTITCGSMVVSLLQVLLPKSGAGNVGRLAGGLVLMLLTIQPLLSLDIEQVMDLAESEWTQAEQLDENELTEIHHEQLEMLIEQETAAYIQDKADSMGLTCSVSVSYEWKTGEAPCPVEVVIESGDPDRSQQMLESFIEFELGIAKEYQVYKGTVE